MRIIFACVLVACVVAVAGQQCPQGSLSFTVDLSQPTVPFNHVWERCVGSGHASLALREDWREQLSRAHDECGFQFVRFHGIFDDDMSVYLPEANTDGKGSDYSFYNVDAVYDFLLGIGMKPIVELSFMPEDMARCNNTVFHYKGGTCPPKDYATWAAMITAFIEHLEERYGAEEVQAWFFEVWNEPNCGFWTATQAEYFTMYNWTVRAIKAVDPKLQVGGPATCQSQWIPEFIEYCNTNKLPYDFVSTHEYPTDVKNVQRNTLQQVFTQARAQAGKTPLFYTEYNSGLYPGLHDDNYASAFVINNVLETQGLVDLMSYWTFSDVFEEQGFISVPFHEGFGMIANYNIAKPVYRAFELLHRSGDRIFNVTGNSASPTVQVLATLDSKKQYLNLLVYNHDIPSSNLTTKTACVNVIGAKNNKAILERIDSAHANATQEWRAMGSPTYLAEKDVRHLQDASKMPREPIVLQQAGNAFQYVLNLEPEAVASITLPL